jgi:hypothetical protein
MADFGPKTKSIFSIVYVINLLNRSVSEKNVPLNCALTPAHESQFSFDCFTIESIWINEMKLRRKLFFGAYEFNVCYSVVTEALCYKPEGRGFETL